MEYQSIRPMIPLDDEMMCCEYMPVWLENIEHENHGLCQRVLDTYEALQQVQPSLSVQQLGNAMFAERNGADFVKACQRLVYLCQQGYWPSERRAS
ncbi:hypothetical protein AAEU32_05450 [Pseudoalteromonas sp. SSDWG2]|uniref:hypothetical protein n=1 Tax=Pseudoalteromonas sp. SSDWG2 TaxID=3139391 RepID=UPI003BAD1CBF